MDNSSLKNYLDIAYHNDSNIVVCRWFDVGGPEILRAGYKHFFSTAQSFPTKAWLLDIRGRGKASEGDDGWYFKELLPDVASGLQEKHFLAYLITPSHYDHVLKNINMDGFNEDHISEKISARFFTSEQEALTWLNSSNF